MQQHPEIRKKRHLPELLAPAGSPEAFHAAVAAGADAVYLSGKRFGARKYATNFTDDELKEAIDFAHRRDVRIYVTINTLIHDRELDDVLEYLLWLYSIGTDAVLIQDIGIAFLARKIVPLLPVHASTQMTIHSTAGVEWAARQGFSRVVLARELTIEEIEDISQATTGSDIGLEVFAHGALCYCYSGQCLLSSVIGGRSGNRGMCAQPCRKPYTMIIADTDPYGRPSGIRELPPPPFEIPAGFPENRRSDEITGICFNCCQYLQESPRCDCRRKISYYYRRSTGSRSCFQPGSDRRVSFWKTRNRSDGKRCTG
jgi:putative protease